jgi:hypothetical protein
MGHDTGQRMDSDVKCTNTVVLAGQVLTLVKCLVRSMLARATYAIGGRQRLLKQLPAASWKRGNTAFILASGASINSLDTSHWDRISEGTKIGFNFWVKHDVVPDLYVFENLHSSLLSLLVSRRVDYSSVPIVLKHQLGLYQIFGRRRALSSSLASLKASGLNVYLSGSSPRWWVSRSRMLGEDTYGLDARGVYPPSDRGRTRVPTYPCPGVERAAARPARVHPDRRPHRR